jgi:hypothetical protein
MPFRKLLSISFAFLAAVFAFAPPAMSDPLIVSGKIVLSNGKPASGAWIRFLVLGLQGQRPVAQAITTAKADGSFYFFVWDNDMKKNGDRPYTQVLFASKGAEVAFIDVTDESVFKKPIVMEQSVPLKARVEDENGKPIAGVDVVVTLLEKRKKNTSYITTYFFLDDNPEGALWKARTDKSGYAEFNHIPYAESITFDIVSKKYLSSADVQVQNLPNGPPEVVIHAGLPCSVSGRVVYSDTNKPAAGIDIVCSADKLLPAKTDANGKYFISNVAPGTYTLYPELDGDIAENWAARAKSGIAMSGGRKIENENFQLVRGGVISGKVFDGTTGKPIADLSIFHIFFTSADNGKTAHQVYLHNDGTYQIRLTQGGYTVSSWQDRGEYVSAVQTIEVKDGETKILNFAQEAAPQVRSIHGSLVDSKGAPIGNMYLFSFSKYSMRMTIVGPDGKFDTDARNGDILFAATDQLSLSAPVTISDSDSQLKLVLDSPVYKARGKVVDSNGKPIAGAKATLLCKALGESSSAFKIPFGNNVSPTDANGYYSCGPIFAGVQYSVEVTANNFAPAQTPFLTAQKGSFLGIPVIKLSKKAGGKQR